MAKFVLSYLDVTACEKENFSDIQKHYREIPGVRSYDDGFKIIQNLVAKFGLKRYSGVTSIAEYPIVRITLQYKADDNHILQFMLEKTE